MKPFDHNKFIGYICEVTPQYVRMQIPSARLLHSFYFNGEIYFGGSVGSFVVIEGQEYGFLGRIFEQSLPQGERAEITDKNINEKDTMFHPIAKIELLALFDVYKPEVINKTVSRYPSVGAKVYSCSDEQMGLYIAKFGIKKDDIDIPLAPLGKLTSNDSLCNISLNSLFGRHCAVLGTTGGGKSWTIAKLLELISSKTSNKCILIDATGEYKRIKSNHILFVIILIRCIRVVIIYDIESSQFLRPRDCVEPFLCFGYKISIRECSSVTDLVRQFFHYHIRELCLLHFRVWIPAKRKHNNKLHIRLGILEISYTEQ